MNIKEIAISRLKEYENNPRNNDLAVEKVRYSIERFGFLFPVIIDQNCVIVCGHTRVRACRELGIQSVPCIVADELTEEQINLFRLVDNKTSEYSDWNYDKLKSELSQVDLTLDVNQLLLERFELSATVFDMDLECGELRIPTFNFLGGGKPASAPKDEKRPPVSTVSSPPPPSPEPVTPPAQEANSPPPIAESAPAQSVPENESPPPVAGSEAPQSVPESEIPPESEPQQTPAANPAPQNAEEPKKPETGSFKPPTLIQFRFGDVSFFISKVELDALNAKYAEYLDSGAMLKTSFASYLLGRVKND